MIRRNMKIISFYVNENEKMNLIGGTCKINLNFSKIIFSLFKGEQETKGRIGSVCPDDKTELRFPRDNGKVLFAQHG